MIPPTLHLPGVPDVLDLLRRVLAALWAPLVAMGHLQAPHQVDQVLDTLTWTVRGAVVVLVLAALVITIRLVRLTLTILTVASRALRLARGAR